MLRKLKGKQLVDQINNLNSAIIGIGNYYQAVNMGNHWTQQIRLLTKIHCIQITQSQNLNLKRRGKNSMALERGWNEDGVDSGRASSARYG